MSLLDKANFYANGNVQFCHLCHVIKCDMLDIYHFSAQLFHTHFPSPTVLSQLQALLWLQQCPAPLKVVITADDVPSHQTFS